MKKRHFLTAILTVSVLTAGLTAFAVREYFKPQTVVSAPEPAAVPSDAGNHFTNYERDRYPDFTYAAENAVKAVVSIEKMEEVSVRSYGNSGFFDPFYEFFSTPESATPRERRSGGSGVIISADGYIVTNNHVVENAKTLKVKLYDNRTFEASIVGADPATDVALIKIEAADLPTLVFGNSDELRLGEWVLAIGTPYDLRSTITAGIVSAKARSLSVIPQDYSVESFIQTDAAVNPGNSGGALVNVRGELVGINTVIKSPTGSYAGYSFAIPEAIVKKVVVDLKEYGVVQRALLGVRYSVIDDAFIERFGEEYGIKELGGVYVSEVEKGGAAEAAGIKVGDVIAEVNGTPIDASATLQETIARYRPNDKIKVTVKSRGKVKHLDVVLRNKAGKAELLDKDHIDAAEALGGTFADINDKAKQKLDIDGGILVQSVKEGGVLSKCRIRRGYIITHINGREIDNKSGLAKITAPIVSLDGVYPDGRIASYSLVQ